MHLVQFAKQSAISLGFITLSLIPANSIVAQQEGGLPTPKLAITSSENIVVRGEKARKFNLIISNSAAFPDSIFTAAPDLAPCRRNTNSSRTWVNIYDTANQRCPIYGFCNLREAKHLNRLWFAIPEGEKIPDQIYVTITDRKLRKTVKSNLVSLNVR